MKPGRQDVILKIISEQNIQTQHQLMQALAERGIKSTQATLSRDIKELRIIKERGADGVSRYAVASQQDEEDIDRKLKAIFRECVLSFDYAQNLFIIHTLPGLASAACSAIDSWELDNMVGTLAGDNTAFLAMRDTESAAAFFSEMERLLKD